MADNNPLTAELERLHAVERAATEGPWEVHRSASFGVRLASDESDWPLAGNFRRDADAEFAAAARTAMPRLLGAVSDLLKPHQPGRRVVSGATCDRHEAHRHFSITEVEAAGVRSCPDCKATVYTSCAGCGPGVSFDACPVRVTVARRLNGGTDGT